MARPVYILGCGSYLPGPPIPFESLGSVLGELPGAPPALQRWMREMTPLLRDLLDIRFVHYALDPATRRFTDDNITMSVKSAQAALRHAGLEAGDVDLICYGSAHQDQMPTASVRIQEALGIESCREFSIHANCTSAYKAMALAYELIRAGRAETALVASASISSSELCAEYYNQALVDKESLFLRWFLCDGAGAAILSARPPPGARFEVETVYTESVGGAKPSLMYNLRPAYWMNPREEYEQGRHHLRQAFRNALSTEVFQEAGGSVFFNGLRRMLRQADVPAERIRFFQINLPARHIVESVQEECRSLGIPDSALYTRLDELGYCGPPMVFICLDRILAEERFQPGDRVVSFVTEVSKFMQAGYSLRYDGPGPS